MWVGVLILLLAAGLAAANLHRVWLRSGTEGVTNLLRSPSYFIACLAVLLLANVWIFLSPVAQQRVRDKNGLPPAS